MKLEEITDDAVSYMLDALASETRLTAWEKGFVESVTDWWERRGHLTDSQKETLGRIWDRY